MSETITLDTASDTANLDLTERDPRLDTLVTEMTGAALPLVPEAERDGFMHAATGMLRELQYEEAEANGQLPLDKLGAVVEHYSRGAIFQRAGVQVMPFVSEQGGFVLATAVGQPKKQQLVHVAAGAHWDDVLTDLTSAGQGQGVNRFDMPHAGEDSLRFQRRALATIEHVAYQEGNTEAFQPVLDALREGHKGLPWRTAVQFRLPDIGTNRFINLAYARLDGVDIMGEPYERVARNGGIDYDSARAIVSYQTAMLMNEVFNSMTPVVGFAK